MVPPRMTRGSNVLKQYGSVLSRIETGYGVPGEVIVAIWGLETDFGVNIGKFQTLRSLATLAYDCRRADEFRAELLDALRIVDRGDLARRHARRLGRRTRPDPVHALVLDEICRRFRRQRQARPPAQCARRAGLDRELSEGYGWQPGKDYQPGAPNFAVIQQWNKSEVYAKTVASFAGQLAKAP